MAKSDRGNGAALAGEAWQQTAARANSRFTVGAQNAINSHPLA